MSEKRLLSIVVCTHNRAASLRDMLEHLARVRTPPGWELEIVVVDNASTDESPAVVREAPLPKPARLLHCQQLGVAHARNMAVASARGEAIIWFDDDIHPDPGILEAYVDALDGHPDCSLFGGPVEPLFLNEPPEWVKHVPEQLWPVYSLRAVSAPDDPFEVGRFPVTANAMCRIEVHRALSFNPGLGWRGGSGLLGEESRFFQEAMALGHCGKWVPAARVSHCIPGSRQSAQYVAKWYASYGESIETISAPGIPAVALLFGVPRWALRAWLQGMFRYVIHRLRRDPASWLPALCAAGTAWGVLRYHVRRVRT